MIYADKIVGHLKLKVVLLIENIWQTHFLIVVIATGHINFNQSRK